ncbi:cytochrome c oxidase subunit 1 [Sporothrix stenoceras]|uniref:Amine oxidase n=1 Tax=Sporothrix stenoceras TaxID=5173 RepID=A0ABR3ZFU0_9PEZI
MNPRRPYHRKQAFDAGDVGFGITANQLSLGCDCLGHIHYFNGYRTDSKGNPVLLQNVICMHEQDNGLQLKHTNYRNNAATVARKRELVVQMICTVSNYEYVLAWIFDQAGNIEHEVRATGILSTMPIDNLDESNPVTVPWGTNVGPGVMAAYHQHLFSLRIDPAIDGHNNTLFYEESEALPVHKETNNFGMGYRATSTVMKKAGFADLNVMRNRIFKIRNDSQINAVSLKPVAYKIHAAPSQMLLMGPDSFARKRAAFAEHAMWVTKYQDDELYAAGEFTNQSRKDTGLSEWAARPDNVENTDIVVWHTFGLTHNPRPEDFPVMPAEQISVRLQPDGFFTKNPALDVPQSTQAFNQSTLHQEATTIASCCSSGKSHL